MLPAKASPPTVHVPSGSRADLPIVLLWAGILVNLLVIWVPEAVGSMDGPIHLAAATDLRLWIGDPSSLARAYLEPGWPLVPNITGELLMAALLGVLDPATAEKVFLSAYVLALSGAFAYVVRGVNARATWAMVIVLPLTFSVAFHFGLFNFAWSVVPFLLVAGYAVRHRGALDARRAAVLGGLLLLTYLTHIVSWVEAVLFVGVLAVWDLALDPRGRLGRDGARLAVRRWREATPAIAAVLPSAALAAGFFLANGTAGSDYRRSLVTLIAGLPSLAWPLVSFERIEVVFTTLVGATLLVLAGAVALGRWRGRTLARPDGGRRWDAVLLFAALGCVAYFVAPEATGSGGLISERLALYPAIGLTIWLAGQPIAPRHATIAAVTVFVAVIGLTAIRWPAYQHMGRSIADYVAIAPCMAHRATMVQANLWYDLPSSLGRVFPLLHDAGRLAARTDGHDLGSITGSVPLYPLRNRADRDPFVYLVTRQNGEYSIPPGISPLGYEARTPGRVDYVVLVGRSMADQATLDDSAWAALKAEIDVGYTLVGRSPSRAVELYERSDSPIVSDGAARRADPTASACRVTP